MEERQDLISRREAINAVDAIRHIASITMSDGDKCIRKSVAKYVLSILPSAQSDIKQAAKLLSDFIESCPGGDSYLITPNGEELRTDWGYAMEGIQLIHDWAERKTDA